MQPKIILPNLLKDYHSDEIFNADETALYYKAVPDRTYQYKNKQSNDIKVFKERLSILLCCTMSGTEKLRRIVIGQYKNPRCFSRVNKSNLPV